MKITILSFFFIFYTVSVIANADIRINEIVASNSNYADTNGENDDWLELYNNGTEAINLHEYYISDDENNIQKWQLLESFEGELILAPATYIILWADNQPEQGAFHLGFTLKKTGETITLTSPDLASSCAIAFPSLLTNIAYGYDVASDSWLFYQTPTPGEENSSTTFQGICPDSDYSVTGGLFSESFTTTLSNSLTGVEIRYTIDNTEPVQSSSLFSDPINISINTNLRTKTFFTNYIPNVSKCESYIFEDGVSLGIITISANGDDFSGSGGIYSNPTNGVEIPVSVSYYDTDGTTVFSQNLGLKIHAPDNAPQKSLRFYARSEYGDSKIDTELFDQRDYDGYKRFILRNGGNDALNLGKTLIRDVLGTSLFGDLDDEYGWSASTAVHAYINGEYWGIYNMRERQDKHWLNQNYGYEADEVDYLERAAEGNTFSVFSGDWDNYNSMEQTAINLDLSDDDNYAIIENWINIENFIDYEMSEIFYGNQDWLSNNMKLWKPLDDSRKWEWIIWDVDYGMGRFYPNYPVGSPDFNYVHFAVSNWGGWTSNVETELLQNLVESQTFLYQFASRGADLMNSSLKADNVQEQIDQYSEILTPDIQMHFDRWNGNSMTNWNNDVTWVGEFLEQRLDWVRLHFTEEFFLGEIYTITLDATPTAGGNIEVNTIETDGFPWLGYYYEDIPVRIKAIPNPGYIFVEWQETGETEQELFVDMISDQTYTAVFESLGDYPPLVINEIYYQGSSTNPGDWIEIYNPNNETIDLSDWKIADASNNSFTFPVGTTINSMDYVLVINDSASFYATYNAIPVSVSIINMNNSVGLNNQNDVVKIISPALTIIDSVNYYNDENEWPLTIINESTQLSAIMLDNTNGVNWFSNIATQETPGMINVEYIDDSILENKTNGHIGAYPNPFDEQLNIIVDLNTSQEVTVKLINAMGKEIYNYGTKSGSNRYKLTIDAELPAGIYFIHILNKNISLVKAVVCNSGIE